MNRTETSRGAMLGWVAGVAAVSVAVLVLALAFGHGAGEQVPDGIPTPGPLTDWGLPVVRLLTDTAGIIAIGLVATVVFLLPSAQGVLTGLALRATRAVSAFALVWVIASVVQGILTVSDVFGQPVTTMIGSQEMFAFFRETSNGYAFVAQVLIGLTLAVAARFVHSIRPAAWLLLLALCLFVPPVLTGHTASSGSHDLATVSLLVHVIAVSLWVGGLAGLGWIAWRGSKRLPAAVTRFSVLAAWCLVAVAISGVFNASLRVRHLSQLLSTDYGVLVLVKVAGLVVLGALGWQHRRRTVPRLKDATDPIVDKGAVWRAFTGLAALEIAVMGATMAVAVALSRTPTPIGEPYTNGVEELLGQRMPPVPTLGRLLVGWSPDGVGLLIVGLAGALYLKGVLVMRQHGNRWPIGRTVSWYGGLFVVAWATFGGLGEYSHVMFSLHMLAHMMLSMIAPILLVMGAPTTLALRTLPAARVSGEVTPRQLLLDVLHSRWVRVLTFPVVAAVLFVGSFYAIYFTPAFPALMDSHLGHAFMEVHFLASGCLFFYVLVGIDPSPMRLSPLVRIALMMFVTPFHAFFSIAVMSGGTVLGRAYWHFLDRPYSTDLLKDQTLGGGISWAFGEVPLLLVMLVVFVQWVRSDARDAKRLDRAADRDEASGSGSELAAYNALLGRLAASDSTTKAPATDTERLAGRDH